MAAESKSEGLKIVAFSGSLRKASTNTGLLRAVKTLCETTDGVASFTIASTDMPLFNEDLITADGAPEAVLAFRAALRGADAIIIATPEYNFSMSAPLKNALDWASKPLVDGDPPMQGKPVAMCGSGGGLGTVRSQMALRQTAVFMQLNVMTMPETLVRRWGGDIFDEAGDLKDNDAGNKERAKLTKMLTAFLPYAARFQ